MKKILLTALLSACLFTLGRAQATLSFLPDNFIAQDTATLLLDSVIFDLRIVNTDTADYSGTLWIYRENLTLGAIADTIYSNPSFFLAAGDTTGIGHMEIPTALRYSAGGVNVLIVWPSTPFAVGASITDSIYIRDPMTTTPHPIEHKEVTLTNNPVKDWLTFEFDPSTALPQTLMLSDAMGKMIKRDVFDGGKINISHLHAGIYFATLEYEDGRTKVFKILKWE